MIPKIIHYCWFGGKPLPESAKKCIASWRKFLPDYEIKEWNESNFDVNGIKYTREAYRLKKYAFVSDYARFWILYKYGGIYFDTDVEVIKNMDDIIAHGNFMGQEVQNEKILKHKGAPTNIENSINGYKINHGLELVVAPGLGLGVAPGLELYKNILDWYKSHHFATWNGKFTGTVVNIVSNVITKLPKEHISGDIIYVGDIYIYPPEYFCPKNYYTGKIKITEHTRSIHHYTATWVRKKRTLPERLKKRINFIRAHFNI
jgi:hypothetical protein